MDGFAVLELMLAFSAFVTCNFNVEGSEGLESIQKAAEFTPATGLATPSTTPPPTETAITTIYTTSNSTYLTHSTEPTSAALITTSNTTQHNRSIATMSSHVTSDTTQHNHSIAMTTTMSSHVTSDTTQHNHSTAKTTTMSSHVTSNTTQHNHSIAITTPISNITTVLTTRETVGPTLSPVPSPPPVLNYSVTRPNSSTNCIQASMGLELIVLNSDEKERYFNIERDGTTSTGTCGEDKSNLNITFNKGFIGITFKKSEDSYYISEIEAVLKVSPQGMLYNGNITNQQLFKTSLGYSFKCASKQTVMLAHNFQFRTVYTQLQAFSINNNKFGKVSQCSADHNIVAIAVGVMVVILIVLGLIIYGIYLKCKSDGYQRI